jgi:hypothetical protein
MISKNNEVLTTHSNKRVLVMLATTTTCILHVYVHAWMGPNLGQ